MYKPKKNIKNKITIYLMIMMVQLTFSQKANDLFVEGNKLYQKEKFKDAIEKFKKIENQGVYSADLYYNIANAYYKTNQVAPAIYYYEKAKQVAPNNKDIQVNLEFAKRMTLDNIEPLPKTIFQKISKTVLQKINYNNWAYIAVFFAFLFALLFLRYHFSEGSAKKRMYFISSILSILFMLLGAVFASHTHKVVENKKEAIIFSEQTTIKKAPILSSETVFELHEGTKVKILKTVDNWKKIKIADGQTGWIVSYELKEL